LTVDVIGYLIGTGSVRDTTRNLKQFFDSIDPDKLNVLINVYRHGITNGHFPKLKVGIKRHSTNPKRQLFSRGEILVLNVNELETIVIDKLGKVKDDVNLYANMETQYDKLITDYMTNVDALINNLIVKL